MNPQGAAGDDADRDVEYIEVRLRRSQLSQIANVPGIEVDVVIAPEKVRAKPRSFAVPINLRRSFGNTGKYKERFRRDGIVAAVNHGEFEQCADNLVANCEKTDAGQDNVPVL